MGEANKNVKPENLVEEGATIDWTGTKGVVTATVKQDPTEVKDLYEEDEQNGHFFPIKFREKYYGQDIVLSGRTAGNKTIRPDEKDPYLIIRLENLDGGNKLTAKVSETQEEVFELDFSKVAKQGEP